MEFDSLKRGRYFEYKTQNFTLHNSCGVFYAAQRFAEQLD